MVATITEQVRAMHAGAFSDDEVDRARRYLAGAWVFDFQTVDQRAERLLELERPGPAPRRAAALARRIPASPPARSQGRSQHLDPDALCRVDLGPSR